MNTASGPAGSGRISTQQSLAHPEESTSAGPKIMVVPAHAKLVSQRVDADGSVTTTYETRPDQVVSQRFDADGSVTTTYENLSSSPMPIAYRGSEGGQISEGPPHDRRQMQSINQSSGETEARCANPQPLVFPQAIPSSQDPTTEAQEHAARMAAATARLQQHMEKRKQMESDQAAREEHAKRMAALTQRLVAAEKRRQELEEKYPGIDTSGPLDLNKKRNRLREEWDDEDEE